MATETDKVNTGALATLVAVGTFATISVVLGVDALVRYETAKITAERASHASDRYRSLVAEQNAKLASGGWVDRGKGIVATPITQAMGHVIADLARDPLSASPQPPPDAGAPTAIAPDAATGAAEPADAGSPEAAPGTAPAASASASGAVAPPKAPAAGSVSPKASTVLAVPPAPPAAPRPAPAAPVPSDG
jgi:hypothetical protein